MTMVKCYKHAQTGRLFEDKSSYLKHCRTYAMNITRAEKERELEMLVLKFCKHILPEVKKEMLTLKGDIDQWEKDLNSYLSEKTRETQNQLDDFRTQLAKAKQGIKICENSLFHQLKEFTEEFKKLRGIPQHQKLAALRSDIASIRDGALPTRFKNDLKCFGEKLKESKAQAKESQEIQIPTPSSTTTSKSVKK